jgi:hypothetical protein
MQHKPPTVEISLLQMKNTEYIFSKAIITHRQNYSAVQFTKILFYAATYSGIFMCILLCVTCHSS